MKVLITGASSGLGAEFARGYAKKSNHLILIARRENRLKDLKKELKDQAKQIDIYKVDITDFDKLKNVIKSIGFVDIAILNAGISLGHDKRDFETIQEVKHIFDTNFFANHVILKELLPLMQHHKNGKVVFISSLASLFSMPTSYIYSSSKSALNSYVEGLKFKYTKYNIKFINILPGFIKSEITEKNNFYMPFLLETKQGVDIMIKAIEKEKEFFAFPLRFYLIINLFRLLPTYIQKKIISKLYKF